MHPAAASQRNGFRLAACCLRRISEQRTEDRIGAHSTNSGIRPNINKAVMRMALLVVERQAGGGLLGSFGQLTERPTRRPSGVVCLEKDFRIVRRAGDPVKLARNLPGPIKLTPVQVKVVQGGERRGAVGRAIDPTGKLDRARIASTCEPTATGAKLPSPF